GAPEAGATALRRDRFEHLVRDVEVRVDVLAVVVVLEFLDQAHDALRGGRVRYCGAFLRDHRELRCLGREAGGLDRISDGGEVLRRARDLEHVAVALDVLGAAVGCGEEELVLVDAVGADDDDAATLELPGDRPGRAEGAAVARERVPDLGGGAVAVVGERLDDHRDALRAVALVDHGRELGRVGPLACALGDRTLDVVLRHRVGARLLDRVLEREVAARVGAALLRRDDDRARELREELAALRVGGALLVLDRRPLAMSGQGSPPRGRARAAGCRRSARGGTTRPGTGPGARARGDRRPRRAPRRRRRRPRSTAHG